MDRTVTREDILAAAFRAGTMQNNNSLPPSGTNLIRPPGGFWFSVSEADWAGYTTSKKRIAAHVAAIKGVSGVEAP